MNNANLPRPFTPINEYEINEPRPERYQSPDIAVAEGIIEEGIRESMLNGEQFVKVTVNGNRIHLSQFLAGDLYKMKLSPSEIEGIFDRYIGVRIAGGELTRGKNPNAALGRGAVRVVDEYDFRERQSGAYLEK